MESMHADKKPALSLPACSLHDKKRSIKRDFSFWHVDCIKHSASDVVLSRLLV